MLGALMMLKRGLHPELLKTPTKRAINWFGFDLNFLKEFRSAMIRYAVLGMF